MAYEEVKDNSEYASFYDYEEYLAVNHFHVEGQSDSDRSGRIRTIGF